jgi:YspA, cpYpsA-related SLOG family
MIVLVCGGRYFKDRSLLVKTMEILDATRGPIVGMIHGYSRGADQLADDWMVYKIAEDKATRGKTDRWLAREPASWVKYGSAAGPIRNQYMLDAHPGIEAVVAFPGGRGTADMVKRARNKGLEVIEVEKTETPHGKETPGIQSSSEVDRR